MLNSIFSNVLSASSSSTFSVTGFLLCMLCSLVLGLAIAWCYTYKNTYSKSFVITVALLPAIVQAVICLVNGNLGTGVAVAGAFSLIRFRSVPGSARDIGTIFLAMAAGLATGVGYIGIAVLFVLIIEVVNLAYMQLGFGDMKSGTRDLKITIPESLDYTSVFTDLFRKYTTSSELLQVKTSNMGSLYKLYYRVCIKDMSKEKEMINELRCRNGNLEITCGMIATPREEL